MPPSTTRKRVEEKTSFSSNHNNLRADRLFPFKKSLSCPGFGNLSIRMTPVIFTSGIKVRHH